MVRGVSLGSLIVTPTPAVGDADVDLAAVEGAADFDTQKVVQHGTLMRLVRFFLLRPERLKPLYPYSFRRTRFHKVHTEPKLNSLVAEDIYERADSDKDVDEEEQASRRGSEERREGGETPTLLDSITADFDEKMRLLLDPHYQSPGGGSTSSGSHQFGEDPEQIRESSATPTFRGRSPVSRSLSGNPPSGRYRKFCSCQLP